jgi:hypothetical protein
MVRSLGSELSWTETTMGEVLSIEEVLAAEADAIHGKDWRAQVILQDQEAQQERTWLNADDRRVSR